MSHKVLPTVLGLMLLFPAHQLSAQIDGYYRIQSAYGLSTNNSIVQVTGRIKANPNQSADAVKTQPGSVIYVKAGDGDEITVGNPLKVKSLRSQGIEVIGDEHWSVDDFAKYISSNNGSMGLESEKETYIRKGYVATIRAMIEYMFKTVADKMGSTAINDMTAAFNKTVSENIDIDMYMLPVSLTQEGHTGTGFRLYETITDMSSVIKFYNDETKYTYGGEQLTNQEAFAKAFEWVYDNSKSLFGANTYNGTDYGKYALGMIRKSDIKILESFARAEILNDYKEATNLDGSAIYLGDDGVSIGINDTDGNDDPVLYAFDFNTIFSNGELLYNWLKLRAYNLLKGDPVFSEKMQDTSIGSKLQNLVSMLENNGYKDVFLNYFPRIHSGLRYYLICGEVQNSSGSTGYYPDEATYNYADGKFGFVSEKDASETAAAGLTVAEKAGDADKWVLNKMDTEDNYFAVVPSSKMQGLDSHYYTTLCVDFPISGVAEGMHLYTMNDNVCTGTDANDNSYSYVELTEVTSADAGTPLIVETVSLNAEDNKITIDNTAPTRYSYADHLLKGTFLSFENTADNFTARGYNTGTVYVLNKNKKDLSNPMGFYKYTGTSLGANKAFVITSATSNSERLVIGASTGETTAINAINAADNQQAGVCYDLSGRSVAQPHHGIYIINGKKVLVK